MNSNPKVTKVVDKYLHKAVKKELAAHIQDSSILREDLSLDSIRLITFFSSAISDLNIEITEFTDNDLVNINTVGDVKTLLSSKVK